MKAYEIDVFMKILKEAVENIDGIEGREVAEEMLEVAYKLFKKIGQDFAIADIIFGKLSKRIKKEDVQFSKIDRIIKNMDSDIQDVAHNFCMRVKKRRLIETIRGQIEIIQKSKIFKGTESYHCNLFRSYYHIIVREAFKAKKRIDDFYKHARVIKKESNEPSITD
jgi:hypothetical protein